MFLRSLLAIAVIAAQMPSRDASISSALDDLNKGRVLDAVGEFKQIVRTDPKNGAAYFYLSTLYTQMNQFDVAERYIRRAMELSPKQSAHYLQLGSIQFRQKHWRAALEFYQEALKLGPGSNEAAVWRSIGDVQVELFDRDAALQAYEASFRLQPQDATTGLALGRFYLDRNETERAIPQLRAALEIDPSMRAAYSVLGRAYRKAGDLRQAIAVLRKSLDADPADQDSRYALGQTFLAVGNVDEGNRELEKYDAIGRQIRIADENYKAAQARIDAGKSREAEQLLRESLQAAPKYGPALHSLGVLLLDRGSARDAAEILRSAVEVNPLNAASWFSLGGAYLKSGRLNDALEAARRAVVLDDDNKEYQKLLTDIQSRMRK